MTGMELLGPAMPMRTDSGWIRVHPVSGSLGILVSRRKVSGLAPRDGTNGEKPFSSSVLAGYNASGGT